MAGSNVVELTDETFDSQVTNAAGPVLVDFWAPWCGPCQRLGPTIDALADEYNGKAMVAKVNVDEARQTAAKFGISGIPALIVFNGGEVVDRLTGLQPKDRLAAALDKQVTTA